MPIAIVVAHAQNRVIGNSATNNIPWHLPPDLKYFRRLTLHHVVVMGYNTWLSLERKPLEKRTNIVISREHGATLDKVISFNKLQVALDTLGRDPEQKIFIIGGGQLFAEALHLRAVTAIHRTIIHRDFEGDILFPELDPQEWRVKLESPHSFGTMGYSHQVLTRF